MIPTSDPKHWRNALIAPDAVLREAIQTLDRCALKIVLVVDADHKLLGTITDGDIRRGLLRGQGLDSPIDNVVHRDPLVVPPGMERALVTHLMQVNKLLQVPVVDPEGRLVDLHLWDATSQPAPRSNLMVIMAGGLGTRLRPHTERCPKPMLEVGGKPMLEHILEHARNQGITRFAFALRYLGHVIEDYFGDGRRWSVQIEYLREDAPLGTAGALSLLGQSPEAPFVVTNGDVLSTIRYSEMLDYHAANRASGTMAVRQHEWQHPFGVVRMEGIDIVAFEEKPVHRSHVNAGVYVLEPAVLNLFEPNQPCDMPELFTRLAQAGERVIAYPIHEQWLDVGHPTDLHAARQDDR